MELRERRLISLVEAPANLDIGSLPLDPLLELEMLVYIDAIISYARMYRRCLSRYRRERC